MTARESGLTMAVLGPSWLEAVLLGMISKEVVPCLENSPPVVKVKDLSISTVQSKLEAGCDSAASCPKPGAVKGKIGAMTVAAFGSIKGVLGNL